MASDNPFACFGNEDDESDIDSNQSFTSSDYGNVSASVSQRDDIVDNRMNKPSSNAAANRDRGRYLAEAYNTNKDKRAATKKDNITPSPKHGQIPVRSSFKEQQSRITGTLWPHRPPLYLGPVHLSDTLEEGGGRGYVAAEELSPGTCVLIEEPVVRGWSEQQIGTRLGLESIKYLLEMNDAKSVMSDMEWLHPTRKKVDLFLKNPSATSSATLLDKIQIVDMMLNMNDAYSADPLNQQMKALVTYADKNKLTNSDRSTLGERDIYRLLLTLRYNGFDSGLYLHFSMFNHSEDPNCIKFRPTGEATSQGYYSEARTLRRIRKGEALTLHYLENPREVSHATRRKILFDQHRFDIGGEQDYKRFLDVNMTKTGHLFNDNERGNHIFQAELVKGMFPASSREGGVSDCQTYHIEKSLDELEDLAKHLNGNNIDKSSLSTLELTVWELITASQSTLENDHHILLSRCRRLHLDVISLLLSKCSLELTEKQSVELVTRLVPSAQQLLESQRSRLGNDHPDVARTSYDFSMGVQFLLSHSPKRLLSLKLVGMESLDQCSKAECSCRLEKERIEELYPRDVDDILISVKRK